MIERSQNSKDLRASDKTLRLFSGEDGALRGLYWRSLLTIAFERLWPLVLPLVLLVALFTSAAWFGLFALMPRWLHIAILSLFALAALAALYLPLRFRSPSADEITARIERTNGLVHEPLAVQSAQLATGANDPLARALWHEHQRRMAERLTNLQSGLPRPHIPQRDPYGLRAVVALLFVTAFAYSFGSGSGLVSDAFYIPAGKGEAAARIDAWVTPPPYTGRAPIFLNANTNVDTQATASDEAIRVPQGSILSLRVIGGSSERLTLTDATGQRREIAPVAAPDTAKDAAAETGEQAAVDGSRNFRHDLQQDATLTLSHSPAQWRFVVTPDNPPTIRFTKEPGHARNGTLQLAYEIDDDYGPAAAYGEIVPLDMDDEEELLPLYEAPDLPLVLPRRGIREATTSKDLSEHPWSGRKVALTLVVEDAAGNIGRSETKIMTLPERPFSNPLARAIVEQRRILALDAMQRDHVRDMVSALMLRPDETIRNMAHYLGLATIRSRLRLAESDDALRETADYMWQVALGIEDGNLSAAEKRLRQAQEALRDALQNGASQEEIEKLSAELRKAMQDFLREFAQRQQQNPNARNMPMDPNARMLTDKDLERMMDQIENLARQGSRDQAEQLLSQLQDMMNNLQMGQQARPGQQGQGQQGQAGQMQQQMNKLGEMMRKQQQLMNETFKLDQQMQQQFGGSDGEFDEDFFPGDDGSMGEGGQSGDVPPDMAQAMRKLQKRQQDLQSELQKLTDDLKGMGIDPNQDFSDAGKSMGNAGDALGRSEGAEASDQQGNALDALRRGGRDMMRQMQQAMGQGEQGQGQSGENGRDPLGRRPGNGGPDFGNDVKIPGEIDIQRAREILDEIRRKLGNALTPQMEKEYLQRLLQFD
ncbi:TIGR02302 family protein [Falsochrobactrum shanghaiense]|uniref:TIGR02302 family protein n=1 Tax=Falsochrobactrum shanghaiense TaxID=2201899 RepID=A0A316JGB8_9HYPH|nr:TIGR02302 family protein [Falsochrobactrum shanghaiense]PWL19669.1 TIGR02302 family protein [Falsochrobactrum shanghaiense]